MPKNNPPTRTNWLDRGGLGPGRPGTCQVGRLVRRPGGPPRQMFKEGVERTHGGWDTTWEIRCQVTYRHVLLREN